MRLATAALSLLLLVSGAGCSGTEGVHERRDPAGAGSPAVATAPPAALDAPSAMPRTTAERLYRLRPELLMSALVGPLLLLAVVLAIGMVRDAARSRGPRP